MSLEWHFENHSHLGFVSPIFSHCTSSAAAFKQVHRGECWKISVGGMLAVFFIPILPFMTLQSIPKFKSWLLPRSKKWEVDSCVGELTNWGVWIVKTISTVSILCQRNLELERHLQKLHSKPNWPPREEVDLKHRVKVLVIPLFRPKNSRNEILDIKENPDRSCCYVIVWIVT